ncbi:hypothetical protein ACFWNH_30590 [Rhodococcus qingshengii]|uniref:hypothetical protein n=1 Tax=Rhodococcus qingshengii TaxID=334542 RepID=UPI003664313C
MRNSVDRETERRTTDAFPASLKAVRGTGYIRVLFGLAVLATLVATPFPDTAIATSTAIGVACVVLVHGVVTLATSQLIVRRTDVAITSVALDCALTVGAIALLVGAWIQLDRSTAYVILGAVAVAVVSAIVVAAVHRPVPVCD